MVSLKIREILSMLFVVFACLLPLTLTAQHAQIKGTISSNHKGVEVANVTILSTSIGSVTDEQGNFKIEGLPRGSYTLVVSCVGYKTARRKFIVQDDVHVLNIDLEEDVSALDEVVITGVSKATTVKENPASIAIISPKAIEKAAENNIIDVLVKNVPGLNAVKTGPNISKPFIRGLGYNRVLTMYDGLRQEGQQWGDEHGIEVDAYNIEKAEVIKGPVSLMYGSDALAGVVSLFPYVPNERDGLVKGKVISEYQSNNALLGNGLRLGYSGSHWRWALRSSYRLAKNYTNRVDGRVYNTGFNEKNLSAMLGHYSQRGESQLNLTLYDNLQGIPDGSRDSLTRWFTKQIAEGIDDDVKNRPLVSAHDLNSYRLSPLHQRIQHYRIYTKSHYQIGDGDIDLLLGFQQNIRREYTHPTATDQAGLNVKLNTINYGVRYNAPSFSNIEMSVGVNGMYQRNKNQDATDFPIPDYQLLDAGLYGYVKWKSNAWTLSGGLRYDQRVIRSNDFYIRHPATGFQRQAHLPDTSGAVLQFASLHQDFNGVSLSIGTTYQISESLSIKANVARGYRAPNISEIASNGLDPGAHIVYIGNRNFVPEFSFQEDIGLQGNLDGITVSIGAFHNQVQHYIYLAQLVDEHGQPIELLQGNKTFQYQQGSAQLYGFEATLEIQPAQWRGFSFHHYASMVHGKNTNREFEGKGINGEYLPFIPPFKWLSSIQQEFRLRSTFVSSFSFKAELDVNAAQHRYLALYQTETKTPGYALLNLSADVEIPYTKNHTIQLQAQVNNVFNTAYQSNLSRLKYFEYFSQSPNGKQGMYSMGRNICLKVIISF
jgi:iron complex outermembrane receptor protein